MTEAEINGLEEGVQYAQGRLLKGGTWGGGTEHQALAIKLKINIVIWDRRHVGNVDANYRQLYICTPQGRVHLTNIAQATNIIREDTHNTIHLLYDHLAMHYEYFGVDERRLPESRSQTVATETLSQRARVEGGKEGK
eukprot:1008228-Pleurochrysis_carterae.AAC.1